MYGAILDHEKRVVRLMTLHDRTLEIFCSPRGSVMLSFLESLDISINDLSSVPVEPPWQEIDLWDYLTENVKPVALHVHHIAPRERKELRKQVGELW